MRVISVRFLCIRHNMYSKAVLPIEMELNATPENDVGDDDDESSVVQTYVDKMNSFRDRL